MKLVKTLPWGSPKFWLTTFVLACALLLVARDRVPANGANPELVPSLSVTDPSWTSAAMIVKGGFLNANVPCSSPGSDARAICVRFWAKDINNSTGASAFQVHFTYPANMLQVSAVTAETAWLGSTGRSVACNPTTLSPGDVTVVCTTLSAVPPFGALGSGLLVSIALESRNLVGPALINFSDSKVLDTPIQPADPSPIPVTVRSLNAYIAPCADMTGDGRVTVADILYVVSKFGTSDPMADLNGDGIVTVQDILIAVGEFGLLCTR